jgi:RNA polymerase subunit RPABC4/transcription elongation factor Spt4
MNMGYIVIYIIQFILPIIICEKIFSDKDRNGGAFIGLFSGLLGLGIIGIMVCSFVPPREGIYFCKSCNKVLNKNFMFCPYCGLNVEKVEYELENDVIIKNGANWACSKCGAINEMYRIKCKKCNKDYKNVEE